MKYDHKNVNIGGKFGRETREKRPISASIFILRNLLSKNNDKSIINIVINRFKPILEKIDVVDKSAPAFGFGTSKRPGSQKHRILLCPGPGTYNLSPLVGLTSTAKSIGIKW